MSEYKRLTERDKNGFVEFEECEKCDYCGSAGCDSFENAINRLAKLEDKIMDVTLIELHCKVGDIVYQFDNGGEIYESKIRSVYYVENTLFYDCGFFAFDNTAIGQSIFLTKVEAEKKLKELQERNQ